MSRIVLETIATLLDAMRPINLSVETGSGKTTLLFSHGSTNHKTFALDGGNGSISQVKQSNVFNKTTVEFIEGPTQITLPAFHFDRPIDVVLIDGPHGYPFPDLEYYYLYPHIREGGILLLDDTQIPTIGRMLTILKADKMWNLRQVIDNLAIFERTDSEAIHPHEDGWWKQGYNEEWHKRITGKSRKTSMTSKILNPVKRLIPYRCQVAAKILLHGAGN